MKNRSFFFLIALFSSTLAPLFAQVEAGNLAPKHVGTGTNDSPHSYENGKGFFGMFDHWIYEHSQRFYPLASQEDPVFIDEYKEFLTDIASQNHHYVGWQAVQYDKYFEPSFMQENTVNANGSFSLTTPASTGIAIWRLSFPANSSYANFYAYQILPGFEDTIVDGVKRADVAQEFHLWRSTFQWKSYPTVRVLRDYINFQLAAHFDPSYTQKVTILKNSYLYNLNHRDSLLYHASAAYRGGEETITMDQWQNYFDLCDQLVSNILADLNNPNGAYNVAYYPELALFYTFTDSATGTVSAHDIVEFTADPDPTLPAKMPFHAVSPYFQDPNEALGYLQQAGAPQLYSASHDNTEAAQITTIEKSLNPSPMPAATPTQQPSSSPDPGHIPQPVPIAN